MKKKQYHIVKVKRRFLEASRPAGGDALELDGDTIFNQYQEYAERLRDYVGENVALLVSFTSFYTKFLILWGVNTGEKLHLLVKICSGSPI